MKNVIIGLTIFLAGMIVSCDNEETKIPLKAVELISPAEGKVFKDTDVKFLWTTSTDKDATHKLYLGKSKNFTDADIVGNDLTDTVYNAKGLEKNKTYFWMIKTTNSTESMSSKVRSFSIINNAPTKPVPTFPKDKSELNKLELNLLWNASTDPEGTAVVYDVYYSESTDFTDDDKEADFNGTKITLQNLKANTTYYWKVVAKDEDGGICESDVFSFKTHVIPNSSLLLPEDNYVGDKPEKLTWETQEGFKYSVLLSKTESFSAADMVASNLTVGEYVIENLEANVKYYWEIIAVNAVGTSFTSDRRAFTYEKTIVGPTYGSFTDRDGKVYKTVIVDGKEWLAENYAFIPEDNASFNYMIPGENPTIMQDGSKVNNPAYDDVKNNANYKKYGLLYSPKLFATIVPAGWHIATDEEMNDLEEYVGMSPEDRDMMSYRGQHAAALMSEDGGWGKKVTNTSGFSAMPAGYGTPDWSNYPKPKSADFETKAYIWTSTKKGTKYVYRCINSSSESEEYKGVKRSSEADSRKMSVRLVKD